MRCQSTHWLSLPPGGSAPSRLLLTRAPCPSLCIKRHTSQVRRPTDPTRLSCRLPSWSPFYSAISLRLLGVLVCQKDCPASPLVLLRKMLMVAPSSCPSLHTAIQVFGPENGLPRVGLGQIAGRPDGVILRRPFLSEQPWVGNAF